MTENLENYTPRLLQELRTEISGFRAETNAQFATVNLAIGNLAQVTVSLKADTTAMRADINTIALAIDHHSTRLDHIEHHLGLDTSKH